MDFDFSKMNQATISFPDCKSIVRYMHLFEKVTNFSAQVTFIS